MESAFSPAVSLTAPARVSLGMPVIPYIYIYIYIYMYVYVCICMYVSGLDFPCDILQDVLISHSTPKQAATLQMTHDLKSLCSVNP